MRFTITAGEKTVTWEDGFVDDPTIYDWIIETDTFWLTPEGPEVIAGLSNEVTAFQTVWHYLGTTTGEEPTTDDQGWILWDEATDYGDDEDE